MVNTNGIIDVLWGIKVNGLDTMELVVGYPDNV